MSTSELEEVREEILRTEKFIQECKDDLKRCTLSHRFLYRMMIKSAKAMLGKLKRKELRIIEDLKYEI